MNLFQTIWNLLTTPNEGIVGIIFNSWGIPFNFIEITIQILLITSILNISFDKKQFLKAILILAVLLGLSTTFLPRPYCAYLNILLYPAIISLVFKSHPVKTLLCEIVPCIITAVFETIYVKLSSLLFNISYEQLALTILPRIIVSLLIYVTMYLIYRFIRYYKLNITFIENMSKKSKIIIVLNIVFAFIAIGMQFYMIGFFISNLPVTITLISTISLIAYFSINVIFSL